MIDKKYIANINQKIIVSNDPYPHAVINDFLPLEIVKKAEEEFIGLNQSVTAGSPQFQKTKKVLYDYSKIPFVLKKTIDFFYSQDFLGILERKFNLKNLLADWKLFGGGLHESFRGGFLKIHSDFVHVRKSKLKRRLNLLLFLNSNWNENWGGAIELWDKKMISAKKIVPPKINNADIFRTDFDSNHGFPEPITCPNNVSRKSLALYYYTQERTFFSISIRRRKYYHAVWKKRPNVNEIKYGDNDPFFKRLKHKFFYRFF